MIGGGGTPPAGRRTAPPAQTPAGAAPAWTPSGASATGASAHSGGTAAPRSAAAGTRAAAKGRPAKGGTPAAGGGKGGRPPGRRRLIDYPREGRSGIRRWLPSWRLILGLLLTVLLLIVATVLVAYARTTIPAPDDFAEAQTTTVYYSDGEQVMGTFGEQNRVLVAGDTIPEHVKDAVVAAEDRTFYENPGISPTGIARALWNNLQGGRQQGGSTITQQYAERYYAGTTTTDYRGKAQEALLAVKLAQAQDKDEILANYLNTIYYGRGSYGIETAARAYFGIGVTELDVAQAALIAGIIPSPNNWDPRNDPERAEERWNYVLDGMVVMGTLEQSARDALTFPETIEYVRSDTLAGPQGYLLDMVQREILEQSAITQDELDRVGYRIVTTIDRRLQDAAVAAVATLPEDKSPNLRTALVSLDSATGAILSLYGGPDFVTQSRNAVTQDRAQAGSTFKPFTLVAHLESGNSLDSRYRGTSGMAIEGWPDGGPGNFGGQNFGNITVVDATADSVNTVYAQMNAEVGPQATIDVAVRAGIPQDTQGLEPVPSNVLGTSSPHPLDMARAFNTLANQGGRTTPHIVRSVEYLRGGTAYEGAKPTEQVFEADVMADTTYALTQVVERGSGTAARDLGRPAAGKTGTSNDNRSAWFVGYTPQVTTAVALYQVGEDGSTEEITPFGGRGQITGGSFPAEVWTAYMIPAMEGLEVLPFPGRADVGEPNTPPIVSIPSVAGMGEAEARAALEAAGFAVAVTTENSNDVPEGIVIGSNPSGEAQVGSTVTIVVSVGPGLVDVPAVAGLDEAGARSALEAAGFVVTVTRQEGTAAQGTVISSNPSGGQAPPGSTVTLIVSSGPAAVVTPTPTPTTPAEPPVDDGGDEDEETEPELPVP
ncbi:transglycosylase domain-containing protein [Actinotalea sp. K2]|uniref:transglycosylase domain-containing protein n=1 Tax=Actinotalea sp. K2 TaxID=2939438 RepID=UPI002017C149|nr:transglycosylase domain-containing protein [Actinotalea sp. K2]MCL3863251.1 transglycosylase domain-containing protein [Actinotalea sp. K2]